MQRFWILILFFTASSSLWAQGWRTGESEVKIFLRNPGDACLLHQLNFNSEAATADGSVHRVYVVPEELTKIRQSGLPYEIIIEDLNRHYAGFWDNHLVPPGYYTYEQIIAIADSLAASFPLICKKVIWGTSIGGRQLASLKISDNVNTDENEPEIMFDGGIHGDEVGGSQNVIMYARDLCKGYGYNPTFTSLINSREIWLYLMVNPDGRANMSRFNNNFVDCNRDLGYMWNANGNSPGAFSQVETRALRECLLENQFSVYTDFHSGAEFLAYPWSYRADMTRDHNAINNLASIYSSTSGYTNLLWGQGYTLMYPINGSSKDFGYGTRGNVSWTMEISNDKQPSASQIALYYNFNKPAMTEMINRCGWGVEGVVTDSVTGKPVRATIWISNYFPVYNDPEVGDFHKFVLPGTYAIRAEANGYKQKTATGIVVPAQGSGSANIQLVPEEKWSGFRVISCQIPGNNFGDEGYTPGSLGRADSIAYALGKDGWLVIDMGDTIFDGTGNDFRVIQHGSPAHTYQVSGSSSMDGPFTLISNGNGTSSFDLAPTTIHKCRYLKVLDTGTVPSSGPGIGLNLDAVEMITPPLIVNFEASSDTTCIGTSVGFIDESGGNPSSWLWSFPGAVPSSSSIQNPVGILYNQPGTYSVSLTISNGTSSSVKIKTDYITVIQPPELNLGNDTAICDWDHLMLDAGNPGSVYLWSTGDTTQVIFVDSTGTGYGDIDYSVQVITPFLCMASDTLNVTFDNCAGVPAKKHGGEVKIFPNPSGDGIFTIDFSGHKAVGYQVISSQGKVMTGGRITASPFHTVIHLCNEPPGIYLVRIFGTNLSKVSKVMVR